MVHSADAAGPLASPDRPSPGPDGPAPGPAPGGGSRLTAAWLQLTVLAAAALAVRLWNLSWGLPDLFEEATPFTVARRFWGEPGGAFSFDPDFFHYPALSFYLHFGAQGVRYLAGSLTGEFPSLDAFRAALSADPASFIAGARWASALLDTGTVLLVWSAARRIFGSRAALAAGALAAVNPLSIAAAQGVNVDVLLVFFLMLTVRASLAPGVREGTRGMLAAGAAVGLAASAKYTGALFLAVPAVVVFVGHFRDGASRGSAARENAGLRSTSRVLLRLLLVPLAAAAVFAALNPFLFLDWEGFMRDFAYEQFHMTYGHLGIDATVGTPAFYLTAVLLPGLGAAALAFAAWGAVVALRGGNAGGAAVVGAALLYLLVILSWEMRADRYALPLVPLFAILAGGAWEHLSARVAGRFGGKLGNEPGRPVGAALLAVLLAAPAIATVAYHGDLRKPDTRTAARLWIEANVSPGSAVVSGPFGLSLPPGRTMVVIPFVATGAEGTAPFYDTRWYEDFELMAASDYDEARYRSEPERFARHLAFFDALDSAWTLLAEFRPGDTLRGPSLRLYAPDPARRSDRFDEDLLRGLRSVDDAGLVAQFARNLSGVLHPRGRVAKVEQLLRLGLEVKPDEPALARMLAFLLHRQDRNAEALLYAEQAAAHGDEGFELLTLRGSILIGSERVAEAEEHLLRAADLRPSSPLPLTLLARIYSGRGDAARLLGTLERYRSLLPPGSAEWHQVGAWIDSVGSEKRE